MSKVSRRKNPDGSIRYTGGRNNPGQYLNGDPLPHVSGGFASFSTGIMETHRKARRHRMRLLAREHKRPAKKIRRVMR